jgi:histidinol phosphatase-like PHP family hydrolase
MQCLYAQRYEEKKLLFDTDCHVHTYWSACADLITIEDYLLYAKKVGLKCFAITDHSNDIYLDQDEREELRRQIHYGGSLLGRTLRRLKGLATTSTPSQTQVIDPKPLLKERAYRLEKYLSEIEAYRKYGVRAGIELEQMPNGEFIFDWDYRDSFDVIVGGVHVIPSLKRGEEVKVVQEEFLFLTMRALEQDIDILAHPTRGLRKAGIAVPVHYPDLIIDKALSRGIALEVNAHSLDPNSTFIYKCIEKGAKLAFNTDSHSLKGFGDFSFHKLMLQEAGINGKELLENCFQLE